MTNFKEFSLSFWRHRCAARWRYAQDSRGTPGAECGLCSRRFSALREVTFLTRHASNLASGGSNPNSARSVDRLSNAPLSAVGHSVK